MHCPRCDAQIESTVATCPHCGEEIGQVTALTPAQRLAGPQQRLSLLPTLEETHVKPTSAPTTVPRRSYELRPLPHLMAFVSAGIIVSLIAIVVLNHLLLGGGQTKQPDNQSPSPSNSLGGPHLLPTATQPKPQPTIISHAPTAVPHPATVTPTATSLPIVTVATTVDSGPTTPTPTLPVPPSPPSLP